MTAETDPMTNSIIHLMTDLMIDPMSDLMTDPMNDSNPLNPMSAFLPGERGWCGCAGVVVVIVLSMTYQNCDVWAVLH